MPRAHSWSNREPTPLEPERWHLVGLTNAGVIIMGMVLGAMVVALVLLRISAV